MQRSKTKTNNRIIHSAKELSDFLDGREVSPGQFMAHCPAHDDQTPSLAIKQGMNGSILLHCHSHCRYEQVMEAIEREGWTLTDRKQFQKDLGLPKGISAKWNGKHYVAHYTYKNADGETFGYTVRYESGSGEKAVIPYFRRENNQWIAGIPKNLTRPVYNLDAIMQSDPGTEVWIVEGEKCADALTECGVLATTSIGGSKSVEKSDWEPLAGHRTILWPDNDQAGHVYAADVFRMLTETGDSVVNCHRVEVDQLDLPDAGDVVDWFDQGHTKKDVLSLPTRPAQTLADFGVVVLEPGEYHQAIREAEQHLLRKNPYAIFQRLGQIVRVMELSRKRMTGSEDHHAGIRPVRKDYLLNLWDRDVIFVKATKHGFSPQDPPVKLANRYLELAGEWHLHELTGLIYAPTLTPDGTVLERPGYDAQSGVYFHNAGFQFQPLPPQPTQDDAAKALRRLRRPFCDFPFVNAEDESVVLAAILTGLVRQSIRNAPMFGFSAPTKGSGKTLLADVVSIIVTGHEITVVSQGKDKEEEQKQLHALLIQGRPVILIDNVERPLGYGALSGVLTAPDQTYSKRILGRTEMVSVPTNVTFLATGNNLTFEGDMTRRALLCMIDPDMEKPEERTDFRIPELADHVKQYRTKYVQAGLTMLQAYITAGKPPQDIPQYGSFEDWSNWIRSALVWLGMADPNLTRLRIEQEDPERTALAKIVHLWSDVYHNDALKVSDIVYDCNDILDSGTTSSPMYELAMALLEVTRTRGKLDGRSIGYWLRSHQNQPVDGMKIIKALFSPKNVAEWHVITQE